MTHEYSGVGRWSLQGKVIAITGAARGMGLAHARACVELGAHVVMMDVRDQLGESAARELGSQVHYVHADVTEESDWERALSIAIDKFGGLQGLVNNAGILTVASMLNTSRADYDRIIAINQTGVFLGMQAAVPLMLRSGGGSIVNVSSTAGLVGIEECFAYSASKFAVRGMTKAAAIELAGTGVRVNSVHPGDTKTPMMEGVDSPAVPSTSAIPLGRYAEADEIASGVCFLLSDASSYMTGAELVLDGGYTTA